MLNMSMSANNVSSADKLLLSISTFTFNPLESAAVVKTLQDTFFLYCLLCICFLFVGGAYVQISRLRPARLFLGQPVQTGMSLSKFVITCLKLMIMPLFLPGVMGIALLFNYVLCNMVMMQILPSIAPVPSNTVLYLSMAVIYLLLSFVFIWRALVIGVIFAWCLIVMVLYLAPYTHNFGKMLFTYYLLMVFMQPIILAITSLGVGIIQAVHVYNPLVQSIWYMVLGALLIIVSLTFILGPITILKLFGSAKNKIKLVI